MAHVARFPLSRILAAFAAAATVASTHASTGASGHAVTAVGGGTFDLNDFLGASRYYGHSTSITGQNTIAFNIEAGHFWNGHESLSHVATNGTNFVASGSTWSGGATAALYDRHATAVAMLIGGRAGGSTTPAAQQRGLAYGTVLRSGALATSWNAPAYALGFNINGATFTTAYDAAFGTADVINSSWGFADTSGTNSFTAYLDGKSFENGRTLLVASAGNSGPASNTVGAPGSGYNGLTVGSLGGPNGFATVSSFSGRGPQDFGYVNSSSVLVTVSGVRAAIDLAAPGESIVTAYYGGQTGGNNPTLAGSADGGSDPSAYSAFNGTSFAAPIVAGGAALVASAARTLPGLSANPAASQGMVVKSLLLTGADKTAGWDNGQQVVTVGAASWIRTTQSLDWATGAGRMNLDRTFDVQVNGTADVAGTSQGALGTVMQMGWDYGASQVGIGNTYVLSGDLLGGSTFTVTLSWMRNVISATQADVAQADLNVSVWSLDAGGSFVTMVAEGASLYNTVEHLSFLLPGSGRYGIMVSYVGNTFDNTVGSVWGNASNLQNYGIAWHGTLVPGPGGLWLLAMAGRRRRRRR